MSLPRLNLLGGVEFQSGSGTPVEVPTRKARALLVYLALQSGQAVPRERLAGLLWGDSDEQRATANLRQSLWVLRKALDTVAPSLLSTSRESVSLDAACLEVDALRFGRLASGDAAEDLEAAVALYRGDFAAGINGHDPSFEQWLEEQRRRLRERMEQALLALAEIKRQARELEDALSIAQRLLAMDPLREGAHRLVMTLYGEMGQREAALRQYERCRDLLADELGVEPEAETEALVQTLRGNGLAPAPEPTAAIPSARPAAVADNPEERQTASGMIARMTGRHPHARHLAAALVLLAAAGLTLAWLRPWAPDVEPASIARMAFPLPDRPSIAVLPFFNMSGDPEQDYFADGITDDIITGLSKVDSLFVIASNSTFVYKGQAVPIRQVAEDLGVHYVLEGSVRRAEGRIRINAQLIDATTGNHVWAERYDQPMTDIFAVQDQVTQRVVLALASQLSIEKQLGEARQETHSPEAYDALLHAFDYMKRYSHENQAMAISYLEQALELDPDYPRAHAALAGVYQEIANDGWDASFGLSQGEAFTRFKQHLKKAMKEPSALVHDIISKSHTNEGRYNQGVAEAKKMIALNPNDAYGYRALGRALNKAGRAPEGVEAMRMAMRLDPRRDDSGWVSYRLGESLYLSGQFDEASEAFARSAERNRNEWSYAFLAASYAQLGRREEAKTALATFDRIMAERGEDPYTVAKVEEWAFRYQRDRALVQEGFRKAGMPEGAVSTVELDWAQDGSPTEVPGAITIDAATAMALIDRGAVVVDVREDRYWSTGHIPSAVHLSLYRDFTEAKLAEVAANDQEVVILAHGSTVSQRAARASARAVHWGYNKVYYFREGVPGWKAAGFPLENAAE